MRTDEEVYFLLPASSRSLASFIFAAMYGDPPVDGSRKWDLWIRKWSSFCDRKTGDGRDRTRCSNEIIEWNGYLCPDGSAAWSCDAPLGSCSSVPSDCSLKSGWPRVGSSLHRNRLGSTGSSSVGERKHVRIVLLSFISFLSVTLIGRL